MTHAQESRVSSTQDNFKLSEESRSSVSALVSRLNSSAFGVDSAENEKLRGDPTKAKEQKMQDPFPWMPGFFNLCQSTVGSRNVKHLENLMNVYLENVTPNVKDCYTKPNRAARLKKSMNATLIFFHLFYQEIKEAFEHSSYLDKMTRLVSMFMDMEIKASLRGKESFTKVSARLTSSLYIFLDNSEEHILDAILMTKYIHKNYRDICRSLLRKLLHNISTYPMNEMLYVRCLLTFKLWKKIVVDPEERKCINKTAMQKLHAPPNLMENIKAMGNFLPRIPKTKKNITLFLMQSNFNLKNTCQEFFKSVKKSQKTAYSQGLGSLEMDKPLFFINTSENTSPRLTEKGDESDSGCSNNLINDLWSSISTAESNVPQTKMLKELTKDKAVAVESVVVQKKKKKLGKKVKKGKKKKQVSSGTKIKKKKKSLLKHSEPTGTEKEGKKLSNLKGKKKKKKKLRLIDESNQVNIKQATPQIDECNQVKAKQALSQIEEFHQMVVKPTSPHRIEECNQSQVKQALPQTDECDQVNVKMDLPQIEESNLLKVKQSLSQVEECKEGKMKQTSLQLEECDPGKVNPSSPQMEQCDQVKMKEAKVESQLDLPKTEKLDGLLSSTGQIQDAEVSSKVEEPLVKKVKIECISNMFGDSQFDINKNMASEAMEQGSTDSGISSEKSSITIAEYNKPIVSADEAIIPSDDLATKSNCKDQVESVFDNSRSDLFTVEKGKDMLNEKEVENLGVEEGKVVDYCHKPKISENSGPVYVCTMGMCDVSLKQELSDDNREMETSEVNINVQIETDSEILDELKPQEMGKCDASASEEEIVIGNDNIFATGNGDLVMEILETQYPMSRGVLSGEFETENPPVSNELESEPSVNMAGFENNIVDYFTSKAIKDDNPSLYYTHSIDDLDWIYDSNNPMKNYEIERPILPSHWMEGEEEEVLESNSSKSFELPKRGMGKMSYREALMSYSRQKELRASSYGRHSSQTYLVTNSSESGSASVETSPLLTSSASGSSSPRSESAVEGVCQENMETCGNLTKSAELSVSSERIPDVSNLRYYNSSNYQKSPETVSCEKESFNSHSSYSFKAGDCRMDNARVVVETMDHSLVNRASSNRLTVDSSTPETSSHKNVGGTGVQQSPVRRKKSPGKLHPENTVDSQNASGKQGAGELSVAQNRASIRGMLLESNTHGKSSNYEPAPLVSSTVPTGQYSQGIVSASQASNIPTNPYPSISTAVGTTQGTALPPIADLWRCSCAECSVGSVNFSTSCLGEKSYSYYGKIPITYETRSDWKSSNEKLLEKIEESLSATTYDLNSDTSLPLKKRLKKAKISYEPAVDTSVIDTKPKTKLEGFPSYPATPMISIAELDLANNDFYKKWNNYFVTTSKESKSVIVDNRASSSTTNIQSSAYLNNQNQTSLSVPSTNYDANLVKSVQPNLYAHCGQCAEKAVSSVCDLTLYSSASCVGQVYPSTSTSTYSCISSSSTKVSNVYSPQQTFNTQHYPLSSRGYYRLQSSTPVGNTASKQEFPQCDSKSVEAADFKSNQSNSKDSSNRKIDLVENMETSYSEKAFSSVTNGDDYLQRCEDKSAPHNSEKSKHCDVEKAVEENDDDDEDDDDDDDEGDVEGEEEDEEDEDDEKETPQYSIVQKSSESRSSVESTKKETTRIMPFRIFLNKNKNRKELAKNSCIRCRMVDCKGNCFRSTAMDLSTPNSEPETIDDDTSEGRCHRRRGRKPKNAKDGDETVRKSKRIGSKRSHHLEYTEFVMNYDKKRRKKHISR